MKKLTLKRNFDHFTLNDMERAFFQFSSVTREELEDYIQRWNETPGRFTQAKIAANGIVLTDKD